MPFCINYSRRSPSTQNQVHFMYLKLYLLQGSNLILSLLLLDFDGFGTIRPNVHGYIKHGGQAYPTGTNHFEDNQPFKLRS